MIINECVGGPLDGHRIFTESTIVRYVGYIDRKRLALYELRKEFGGELTPFELCEAVNAQGGYDHCGVHWAPGKLVFERYLKPDETLDSVLDTYTN